MPSNLEIAFDVAVAYEGFPPYEPEYRFHPRRRWRFDRAWPARKIAVELEGGVFTGGRHVRPTGFIEDCRKYNTAAIYGWLVLRLTPGDIENGDAFDYIRAAFRVRPASVVHVQQLPPQGGTTHVRRT